jgi:hypothetical protein
MGPASPGGVGAWDPWDPCQIRYGSRPKLQKMRHYQCLTDGGTHGTHGIHKNNKGGSENAASALSEDPPDGE